MKNHKNRWSKHITELIVVFIGVTLAFLSENIREDYKERKLAKTYINSFKKELITDNIELDKVIDTNKTKLESANKYILAISEEKYDKDQILSIIVDVLQIDSFSSKQVTYKSIINSGNLNLIKNQMLKEKLVQYYMQIEDNKKQDEIFMVYLQDYIMPFLFTKIDMIEITQGRLDDVSEFKSRDFKNIFIGYMNLLTINITNMEQLKQSNSQLVDLM